MSYIRLVCLLSLAFSCMGEVLRGFRTRRGNQWTVDDVKLTKEGYSVVVNERNNTAMSNFIKNFVKSLGGEVKDEAALMSVVPFYSGVEKLQTYEELTIDLADAPWMDWSHVRPEFKDRLQALRDVRIRERKTRLLELNAVGAALGATGSLGDRGYFTLASLRNDEQMELYIRRVIVAHGGYITNEDKLRGIVAFYSGTTSMQSYGALVKELSLAIFVEHFDADKDAEASLISGSFPMTKAESAIVPLTAEGYDKVKDLHSVAAMDIFIRRLLGAFGAKSDDDGKFQAMVSSYVNSSSSTFVDLVSGMHRCSWIVGFPQSDEPIIDALPEEQTSEDKTDVASIAAVVAAEPIASHVAEPVAKPVAYHAAEPIAEPAAQPALAAGSAKAPAAGEAAIAAQPAAEPVPASATAPADTPAAKSKPKNAVALAPVADAAAAATKIDAKPALGFADALGPGSDALVDAAAAAAVKAEPVMQSAAELTADPAAEPVAKPASQSAVAPAVSPVAKPAPDIAVAPAPGPSAHSDAAAAAAKVDAEPALSFADALGPGSDALVDAAAAAVKVDVEPFNQSAAKFAAKPVAETQALADTPAAQPAPDIGVQRAPGLARLAALADAAATAAKLDRERDAQSAALPVVKLASEVAAAPAKQSDALPAVPALKPPAAASAPSPTSLKLAAAPALGYAAGRSLSTGRAYISQ